MSSKRSRWVTKLILSAATAIITLFTTFTSYLAAPAAASGIAFQDISHSYAYQSIISLYAKGILTGTQPGYFSPKKAVTRAEWVTALDRTLGLEPVQAVVSSYRDVPKQAWYYGWIEAASQLDIVQGGSSATFHPNSPITRQEAALMIARLIRSSDGSGDATSSFTDRDEIADWALEGVTTVNLYGFMKGENNYFRPASSLTREETAALLERLLTYSTQHARQAASTASSIRLGWQYDQTDQQFENTVLQSNINTLSPRWFFLNETGIISDYTSSSLLTWSKQHQKKIWAMVGNRSNLTLTHQILSSEVLRAKTITQLANAVSVHDLDGLVIDFENVDGQDQAYLTLFIQQLKTALKSQNAVLALCVSPDYGTDWTAAFDYEQLGVAADYLILMGYDEHWGGSSIPGSVSSLPWLRESVRRFVQTTDPAKAILALPLFTRNWTLNASGQSVASSDISLDQQNQLVSRSSSKPIWHEDIQQYTVSYKDTQLHKLWLEEGRSFTRKYRLGQDEGFAGFAYWYTGGASSDLWSSVKNADRFIQRGL
ncbi:S-layer homology domain-containing protein [Paenibacillus ottowii]|uniref:S-layer homology domain-containing protein n=1 Tax=Paenibacillus ottowii TaxID=2315729 RepID=UPI002730810E|nr:S-layer homology domain-containing protein [Paenibacillus ottowii]MDP1509476.1 S-layer homology domain-containing protein [Paenibacillus ottowii]